MTLYEENRKQGFSYIQPIETALQMRSRAVFLYIRWRQEDAHRNSLNAHCYWMLRKEGVSELAATQKLEGKSISFKNELLFSRGINYDKLPAWQKRGIGLWKETFVKEGYDPIRKAAVPAVRNRLTVCEELPLGEEYAKLIRGFLEKQEQ